MAGLFYYLLCIITGLAAISVFLPGIGNFTEKTYSGKKIDFPSVFVLFPASVIVGTLPMAWLTYALACAFSKSENPLGTANVITIIADLIFIGTVFAFRRKAVFQTVKNSVRGIRAKDIIFLLFVSSITFFIMFLTFYVSNGALGVGLSVFSDFAPHLGMIRSFSCGNNFPTSYSHFAGEDIKYHFMFQFLVGNMEFLGMRIDLAFNIPSAVCMICLCMLLYSLSVKLFGKRAVGMLAVLFFLFRSGSAFTDYISEIDGSFKDIVQSLKDNGSYIGKTEHEDWGLWNLNVYVNQRHLAFGMAMAVLAVMLMLEPVFSAIKRISEKLKKITEKSGYGFFAESACFVRESLFSKEGWLVKSFRLPIFCGLMLGAGAFFNGACVIAALLVLFFLAFIADRRLEYLIAAAIAVLLSLLQSKIFINGSALQLRWEPGFLAQVKTFFGTVKYLNMLLGILPVVLAAAFLMVNGWYRWILAAFISPIIFAVTFQMTTDVAVNHKYIMIGCMFVCAFAAALIYKIYVKRGIAAKAAAILIICLMTCTGIYDFSVLVKKNAPSNSGSVLFDLNDPVTRWVMSHSDADDIFLTDWYSLSNVVLGGGMLYYGWPYYAWSAGYDTLEREEQVHMMYEAPDPDTLRQLVEKNNIRYIVVEFANRTNENYFVREDVIQTTFECVYTQGEGEWKFSIYDTKSVKL